MNVGLVSDVHANLPALEAVLEDMPPVDAVVCAGDVVGYNPWPAECVERVRGVADAVVVGNHDRTVETPERYRANHMAEAGLRRAKAELSDDQREWLASLPRRTEFGDGRYLLVHDHPERQDAYVYPEEFEAMGRYLGSYDGLVLGHTHVQHEAAADGKLVVNPGSVGQPRDRDPKAGYAVLDADAGTVDLRRVAYDVERVREAVAEAGLPAETGDRLAEGR